MLRSYTQLKKLFARRICLLLSLILILQLFPLMNETAAAASDGMIRVRLTKVGTPNSISFRTTGSFNVAGQTVASGSTVTVALSAGKLTMTTGTTVLAQGSSITFNRNSTGSGCGVRFTSPSLANLYCGDLIFSVSGSGIQTVLRIYIETYLYGVVPYEMSNSYPIEALKAQAIAARTFALRAKGSSGSYDVNDNANSQVFRGYSSAYSNAINAVDATRGVCLLSGGSYAQCVYTASNGGQIESSRNAWGGAAVSYLSIKDDPYDLENPGSTLKKATIHKKGSSMTSAVSQAILSAAASKLKSAGISSATIVSVNSAKLHSPNHDAPSRTYTKLQLNVTFSGNGKKATLDVDLATYNGLETTLGLSINSSDNEIISVSETSDAFVLEFRRWGHGVGLSQRGAQWMAQTYGMNCNDILSFYYPGTRQSTFTLSDVLSTSTGSVEVTAPPTETQFGYTTLQEGSTGEAVKALQVKLKELGYFTGTPLGNYMTLTVTAVRAFQIDHDLTPDGIATPAVQKLIFEGVAVSKTPEPSSVPEATATPEPSSSTYVTLKYGDTGEAVKALQRRLKELGFFSGTIGGNYLTLTQTAVEDFQRASGLTVDGVATPALQELLFKETPLSQPSSPAPAGTPDPEGTMEQTAVVSLDDAGSRLNVRQSASTASAVVGTLAHGASVIVTGQSGEWSAVRAGSLSGYVMTKFLRLAQSTPEPVATAEPSATPEPSSTPEPTVTSEPSGTPEPEATPAPYNASVVLSDVSSRLNVRERPSTDSDVVATLGHGDVVIVTGQSGEWSAIRTDRMSGYVKTQYLKAVASVPDAPSSAPTATAAPTEPSSSYSTLQYGDSGEAVKALQRRLKELGYFTGNIGGNYLTLTRSAVEAYQKARGLTADGIATPQLQAMIFSAQPAATLAPTATPVPAATATPTAAPTAAPTTVPVAERTAYVSLGNNSGRLNVREAPSATAQIIGRLANGTAVTVTGTSGDWSAIKANGLTGYVSSAYLTAAMPTSTTVQTTTVPQQPMQTTQSASTPQPAITMKPSTMQYATLRPGDTGESVKALQRKLKELGYFTGNIGGNYLTLTETAVKTYQKAKGLPEDGIATPELQKMLFETDSPSASVQATAVPANATIAVGSGTYLNLRASADAKSKKLAQMYDGDRVSIMGEQGEWYKVSYKGKTGYALKEFIRKD